MRRYRWIIFGLLAMLIGSWVALYYYYDKSHQKRRLVTKVVARTLIAQGERIRKENLTFVKVDGASLFNQRQPSLNEILSSYAKRTIYPLEFITKEMLTLHPIVPKKRIPIKKEKKLAIQQSNKPLISEKFFQNPNIPLKKGEVVDIVAALPTKKGISLRYAAINVPLLGFVQKGRFIPNTNGKRVDFFVFDLGPKKLMKLFKEAYETLPLNQKGIYRILQRDHAHLWLVPTKKQSNLTLAKIRYLYQRALHAKKKRKVSVYYEE